MRLISDLLVASVDINGICLDIIDILYTTFHAYYNY
ncbi:hypothetical protein TcasGA2_TC031681 [Tribolium castaneum]|uniref:Uncharacterized protein n=1 Tax=Tribolium castaneum TaxID=7070 RepID=A0A139W8P2_TRICA|nr:hypothetical protein TcasGA2_TC031681 [Tribolium castaneum]